MAPYRAPLLGAALVLVLAAAPVGRAAGSAVAPAATDSVDEIHYDYGEAPGTVRVYWRGPATTLAYGPTSAYGSTVAATASPITPIDIAGPFMRATVSGLDPGVTYHYRIGATGADHTLSTAPTGSFRFADIGDTGSTLCDPWMAQQHQLLAAQGAAFVSHGGDISYANECGVPAVHRFFQDIQAWSESAALQVAWGNHEYGPPNDESPPGTPRDTMANYKGRLQLTNAQTLPSSDTATQTGPPGCATGAAGVNSCRGDDWGWYRAGGVLFIDYPDAWWHAYADWLPRADALMAAAQSDPSVDFVVTIGHRPAYSSDTADTNADLRSALTTLASRYSPTAAHPNGKYVLEIGHHVHAEEVFAAQGGLVEINNGGGGAGQVSFDTPAPHSILRILHPAILRGDYDAYAGTLSVAIVCGAVYTPKPKDPCTYGTTLYSQTFVAASGYGDPPPPPPDGTEWVTNPSVEANLTGWTGTYGPSPAVTVSRDASVAHTGSWSIRVAAGAGATGLNSGFSDGQGTMTHTVAGTTYTASAWVRADAPGQTVHLRLREWNGSSLVTDRHVSIGPADTAWHRLSVPLTAALSGSRLAVAVYDSGFTTGQSFHADDMSLVS